jgi:O-antigen/teichoic acid export membrane protein
VSNLGGQLIGFAVLAVVARRVGAANLGAYGWANNVIPYIVLPLVGLTAVAQRNIAKDPVRAAEIAGGVLPTLVLYTVIVTLALFGLAPYVAPTPVAATILRILSLTVGFRLLTTDWWLGGLGEFKQLAVARFVGQVAYGVAAIFWLTGGLQGVYRYAWLNVLGFAVTFVLVGAWSVRRSGRPRVTSTARDARRGLIESMPLTTSMFMITIYYSADFVLLGFLATSSAVGQYVVAYKLPLALLGFASLWNGVVFTHAATEEPEQLRHQIGIWLTMTVVAMLPVCTGSMFVARGLIRAFFGAGYGSAALYFQLLMVSVAIALVNGVFAPVLLAIGHERAVARSVTIGAVVNLSLNVILIPAFGAAGAAIATIAAEAGVFAFIWRDVCKLIGVPAVVWSRVLAAVASAAAMAGVLVGLTDQMVWWRILGGGAAFCVVGVATGVVRPSDRRLIMKAAA